jgi:hypothetical protein
MEFPFKLLTTIIIRNFLLIIINLNLKKNHFPKYFATITLLIKKKRLLPLLYTGYFTIDEPGGIENATHNTFPKLTWLFFKHRIVLK